MSFKNMKKQSKSFDELAEQLEESNSGGKKSYQDDRFWYPKLDEAGNGYAIIRFLPTAEGEEFPWVKTMNHGFRDIGGWYINPCHTTIGEECPVCKSNSEIVNSHGGWDDTPAPDKKIVRDRKRKIQYVSNIYVVSDSKNPENEGKVFLFKFGAKIFNKLMSAVKPQFEDETPINPFDFWEGANFKLKIRKVEGQTNYDSSEFEVVSQLLDTDDAMEEVYNKEYAISELIAKDKFPTYEKAEERLNQVLGKTNRGAVNESAESYNVAEQASAGSTAEASEPASDDGGEDDAMAFFAGLAEE